MRKKFFLQICDAFENLSIEKLLPNDCFFVDKTNLNNLINNLHLFNNLKPIQIFQIEINQFNNKTVEETIWNWIVECETGVK